VTAGRDLPQGRTRSPRSPRTAQQAPGVAKIRLSGDRADIEAAAFALAGICEVLNRSGPRSNRYDPGERVYLTIRIGPAGPAGSSLRA
jgi:hypothetical protein